MHDHDLDWLDPLVTAFDLGQVEHQERLQSGWLQQTWRLRTDRGTFIAQRLHPIFDPAVTEDAQIVSRHLRSWGIPTPEYRLTQTGSLHWQEQDHLWRVMPCLPGQTHLKIVDPHWLEAVGRVVGHMHLALADFEHQFQFQIPHFHDTPQIWQSLQELTIPPEIEAEAQFLIQTTPQLFLPSDLPQQIIHGDLKISNFLFDDQGTVLGLIDLDTFMYHNRYVDLGDAFRSWASQAAGFNLESFQAGLRGYARSGALSELKPSLIVQGIQLITLELAIRFLRDYVEDYYFDWQPQLYPSRKAHNLARCHKQISIYQDLCRQEQVLQESAEAIWMMGMDR